ncbi:MAG: SPOR domain-containing protein [Bacteroidaceae bacterium]|nr:SPOR domain-containing protein [Bacteroidaceae bacterium]
MKELSQHIASLLLENDCVIIPGFGGFIAHYNPAQLVEEDHLFLPPMRIVGFNPQLRINDGLLAQSYMSVYGTTFPDAVKMIEQQVKELTSSLHETGRMELENVGELHFNIHGKYEFTPFDNRISTPGFYGLDSFKILELKNLQPKQEVTELPITSKTMVQRPVAEQKEEKTVTIVHMQPVIKDEPIAPQESLTLQEPKGKLPVKTNEEKAKVVSFRRYWYQVASVAAILLIIIGSIFLTTPFKNSDISKTEANVLPKEILNESLAMSSIVTHQTTDDKQTTDDQISNIQENKSIDVTSKQDAPTSQVAISQPITSPAPTLKLYNVIVASVGNPEAAQKAAENLVKEGYPHAKAIIGEGKARVSVDSFEKEADAYRAIQHYQAKGQFDAAWVLRR